MTNKIEMTIYLDIETDEFLQMILSSFATTTGVSHIDIPALNKSWNNVGSCKPITKVPEKWWNKFYRRR